MPSTSTEPKTPPGLDIGAGHRERRGAALEQRGAPRPETDPSPASEAEPPAERSLEERREAFQKLRQRAMTGGEEARERRKDVDGDTYTREDPEDPEDEEVEDDEEDVEDEDARGEDDDQVDDEEEDDDDEGRSAKEQRAEKERRGRQTREEHESNRLNKAIRLLQTRGKLSPETVRGMPKRAILETSRALREVIRERDELRRASATSRSTAEADSTSDTADARERQSSSLADDLASVFDPATFDDRTVGAMRGYSKKVEGVVQKAVQPLNQQAARLALALNELYFESARQHLRERFPRLDDAKVSVQFEKKLARALKSGDYSPEDYPTLSSRVRAAADDVAGRMFPSRKGQPDVTRGVRNSRLDTETRSSAKGRSPLARKREAIRLLASGVSPAEARRIAGVDQDE